MSYPNFLIIGAMKAGTNSAIYHLNQHPDVFLCPKEVHYFDKKYHLPNSKKQYLNKFKRTAARMRGEKTPIYMCSKETMQRIYNFNPNVKLIIFLREPIQRAHSHYRFVMKRRMKECDSNVIQMTFQEFLDTEEKSYHHPLTRGLYHQQITDILELFPRENILILVAEEVKACPIKEYGKIFSFLGADPYDIKFDPNIHRSIEIELSKQEIEGLFPFYHEANQKLYEFLGRTIEDWENFYLRSLSATPDKVQ